MKQQTILQYLKLNEARADDEYAKTYSTIDREVFDKICLMDPKTQRSGDSVINIGFGAKQLLLPAYLKGETDFIEQADTIYANLEAYYPNIKNYPKFNEFESVANFLQFMSDPVEISPDKAQNTKIDKITSIYDKYYSEIPRETFDSIIRIDPQTNDNQIGDVAKNLLLRLFMQGKGRSITRTNSALMAAIDRYYEQSNTYEPEKQNLLNYEDIKSFIDYLPPSPTSLAAAQGSHGAIEGQDFKRIATSLNYDIFQPLTFRGSERLAHSRGGPNVWCTAGGSSGLMYGASADHSVSTSYWRSYSNDGPIYMFMHKYEPTDIRKNYNMSYKNGQVYHFLNGNNEGPYSCDRRLQKSYGSVHGNWEAFLLANPEVAVALASCNEPNLANEISVQAVAKSASMSKKPFIIQSEDDLINYFHHVDLYKSCIVDLEISNIKKIPAGLFANSLALKTVKLGSGIQEIGDQAFKNCSALISIGTELPETLETIGVEAFMGCRDLKGSIRVGPALKTVKLRAFDGAKCKLKIDPSKRNDPIKFNKQDMKWVYAHVQSIKS